MRAARGGVRRARRCARGSPARTRVRREAPFAFTLEPDGGPLVHGIVDVLADEPDGGVLIVDYKTNPLEGRRPGRAHRRRLRDPAARLRARRAARRRAAGRGRPLLPRAARPSRRVAVFTARRTRRRSPRASPTRAARPAARATSRPTADTRTASCAAAARAGGRCARTPRARRLRSRWCRRRRRWSAAATDDVAVW